MRNKKKLIVFGMICVVALLAASGAGVLAFHGDKGNLIGTYGNGQPNNQPLAAQGFTPCTNGFAGTFPCAGIDLLSFLPHDTLGGGTGNDIWGWTDNLTGKEYALVGRSSGTSFVDISNPTSPVYLGNLPTHSANSIWRGIKVYKDHAFVVSEAAGHGMQVFDLRQLRNVQPSAAPVTFTETAHYGGFGNGHTLAMNEETGFAYAAGTGTCSGGLHIIDVRNPVAPTYAGCFAADGYSHETQCVTYRGTDLEHRGKEICFNSNEDTLTIVDVTDKGAPRQLSRLPYDGARYTHQGWLTEDGTHFLVDDELDEIRLGTKTRTHVINVSDLDAPAYVGFHQHATPSIDHNLYIRGRYVFESNYTSGLRILRLDNVATAAMSEVGFFDVFPVNDNPDFAGTWSNYPFFSSGTVIVNGIEQGLFVLRPTSLPCKTTLAPIADAYVKGATPDANFGSAPDLQIKRTLNTGAGKGRQSYLRFDTSAVIGDVTRATLRVHGSLNSTTAGNIALPCAVFPVSTEWMENALTWTNKPAPNVPSELARVVVADSLAQWYEFDITNFIKAERAAGRATTGVLLRNMERGGVGDFYTLFNSREAATNQPQLVIEQ